MCRHNLSKIIRPETKFCKTVLSSFTLLSDKLERLSLEYILGRLIFVGKTLTLPSGALYKVLDTPANVRLYAAVDGVQSETI